MTAKPSASYDPGVSNTATTSALSPGTTPHEAKVQPTKTQNLVSRPSQEAHEFQSDKSNPVVEDVQSTSRNDLNDPKDGFGLEDVPHGRVEISEDPKKPASSTKPADSLATPTPHQSQIVPQASQSHNPSPQSSL